jgi:hypothetical protein
MDSEAIPEREKQNKFSPRVLMVTGVFLMCFALVVCVLGTAGSVFQVIRGTGNSTEQCSNFTNWDETSMGQVIPSLQEL